MKLGIMQPYFFPYIGYWQLINAVDTFVIYDDVNYIKQGYINRNSILVNGKPQWFTLGLQGSSSSKLINEIEVGNNGQKLLKTIQHNYNKAPFYKEVVTLVEDILNNKEKNLARYVGYSIERISEYLELSTKIIYSSQLDKKCELKAQDKVIDICKNLNASSYINSIGGQELYNREAFKKNNISLLFLRANLQQYKQFDNEFVPFLSIIDIMMFNDKESIASYIQDFKLV